MNSGNPQLSYTPPTNAPTLILVQLTSFTQVSTMLSTVLSTLKNQIQPLLIADLYPVSTAPTIKKKKENKERNS